MPEYIGHCNEEIIEEREILRDFRLHWKGGKTEDIQGRDIADAFRRAGYSGGAIRALDWYEPL